MRSFFHLLCWCRYDRLFSSTSVVPGTNTVTQTGKEPVLGPGPHEGGYRSDPVAETRTVETRPWTLSPRYCRDFPETFDTSLHVCTV